MTKKAVTLALTVLILFSVAQITLACNPTPKPCTPRPTCKSTPTPELISIMVVPPRMTLRELRSKGHPLIIIAKFSNGKAFPVTDSAEFYSANSNIAYVEQKRHLYTVCSGDTPGQTIITVTYQGKSDICIVTVGKCHTVPTATPEPTQNPTSTPTPTVTPTVEPTATPTATPAPNQAPVLNFIGAQTATEGALLQFTISATDPDGDPITYQAIGLPTSASLDQTTGVFQWIPDYGQAEQPSPVVLFEVSDGRGGQASESVTITVNDCNRFPIFNPTGNKIVNEGQLLQFTVSASDPDGDPLVYSASGLPRGATFDPAVGLFSWTPDYNQAGKPGPLVTFTVTDGTNPEITQFVAININDVDLTELLPNPNFDTGIANWYCIYFDDSPAKASAGWDTTDYDTSAVEPGSLKVQCANQGAVYKEIQLFTNRFNLVQGKTYLLTFKAKANVRFTIPYIKLNEAAVPWTDYAQPYSNLTITTSWQSYAAIFTANITTAEGRLTFFLGTGLPSGATLNIDTVSLKEIVVYSPSASEMLPNADFDSGVAKWNCYADSTALAAGYLDAADYDTSPVSYKIQCVNNGDTLNSIQFFTMPFAIEQGKSYQLTFKAKCDASFNIPSIRLMKATNPWEAYATPYTSAIITPGWQTYTIIFTANTTATDGRLTFFLGNALPDGATFYIDSLSLQEITP